MTKALSVFRDALQEFVLPSGGHFQTCSTENKMQLCNCYLRNRQRDHRGTQSHTRSTQFCFENIYSGKKKKQKTNSWIHTDSGSNALKGHSCTKQSSPVHHQRKLSASLAATCAPAYSSLQAQQQWQSSPEGHSKSQA